MSKAMSENMFGDVVGNKFGNSVGSIFVVLGTCVIIKGSYGAPVLNLGSFCTYLSLTPPSLNPEYLSMAHPDSTPELCQKQNHIQTIR